MKLLDLNIWSGRIWSQVEDFFAKNQFDFICLQEAIHIPGGRAEIVMSIEELQPMIKTEHLFFSPAFGFTMHSRHAQLGNLIASREPLIATNSFFTNGEYIDDVDLIKHSSNMRNFQHVTINRPSGPLHILNHHGYWIGEHKNGNDQTLKACQTIADYVQNLDGQIILSGDFNLAPHSESIEVLNKVLINLPVEHRLKTTRTKLTHKTEVCDYIFVNDKVRVKSFDALDLLVSDHRPLVLEFE